MKGHLGARPAGWIVVAMLILACAGVGVCVVPFPECPDRTHILNVVYRELVDRHGYDLKPDSCARCRDRGKVTFLNRWLRRSTSE